MPGGIGALLRGSLWGRRPGRALLDSRRTPWQPRPGSSGGRQAIETVRCREQPRPAIVTMLRRNLARGQGMNEAMKAAEAMLMVAAKRQWKLPELDKAIDHLILQSTNNKPEGKRKAAKEIARMVLGE
jgi:hypothetical protein